MANVLGLLGILLFFAILVGAIRPRGGTRQ